MEDVIKQKCTCQEPHKWTTNTLLQNPYAGDLKAIKDYTICLITWRIYSPTGIPTIFQMLKALSFIVYSYYHLLFIWSSISRPCSRPHCNRYWKNRPKGLVPVHSSGSKPSQRVSMWKALLDKCLAKNINKSRKEKGQEDESNCDMILGLYILKLWSWQKQDQAQKDKTKT